MVPDILTAPCDSHWPHTISYRPKGFGVMPDIRCVMCDYSLHSIHLFSGPSSAGAQGIDKLDKRPVQFSKVGDFRRPVIHLNIYVDMVVCAPGRTKTVGPYSLQVCRQVTGPGTADEQVPAKLVVKLDQVCIGVSVLYGNDTGVSREIVTVR